MHRRKDQSIHEQVVEEKLEAILSAVYKLLQKETYFMSTQSDAMDALEKSVARNTSVTASALTLIQGFSAQLTAAGTDPAKLAALKAAIDAADDALAAAVPANTPVAGTPAA
jgi:hypothetical protein